MTPWLILATPFIVIAILLRIFIWALDQSERKPDMHADDWTKEHGLY